MNSAIGSPVLVIKLILVDTLIIKHSNRLLTDGCMPPEPLLLSTKQVGHLGKKPKCVEAWY